MSGINLSIGPQDRIALLGPNGAGKSTLTKMLAGEAAPLAGRRIAAADLAVGYFAQQQMEQLQTDCTAFWHVRNRGGPDYASGDEQRVRDHLGRFGFQGDRVFEPVGRFSGGEKARLTLALVVARRPNLLLLDEPTNHLDIDMRHALTVALQGFEGGLILVSHDRHLIKSVADTLWLVAGGKIERLRRRFGRLPAMAEIARQGSRRRRKAPENPRMRRAQRTPRAAGAANLRRSSGGLPPSPPSRNRSKSNFAVHPDSAYSRQERRASSAMPPRWRRVGWRSEPHSTRRPSGSPSNIQTNS